MTDLSGTLSMKHLVIVSILNKSYITTYTIIEYERVKDQSSNSSENNEDIIVKILSVNRKYVKITHESDLDNDDITEVLNELLDYYEIYGVITQQNLMKVVNKQEMS